MEKLRSISELFNNLAGLDVPIRMALLKAMLHADAPNHTELIEELFAQIRITRPDPEVVSQEALKDIGDQFFRDKDYFSIVKSAETQADQVLIATLRHCVTEGTPDFKGADITAFLKMSGIEIRNVSVPLKELMGRTPRQIDLADETAKHARKEYRLTTSGLEAAKKLISDLASER